MDGSTCSGMFRGVHAQVCSWRSTCLVMFMEEYMLRYVHGGVHAQVCSERSTCSSMFREEYMPRYFQIGSTCSGMFREEYMLRYVQRGVQKSAGSGTA